MEHLIKGFVIGFSLTMMALCSPAVAQELPDADEEADIRSKPVECYAAQSVIQEADNRGLVVFWQGSNLKDGFPDNTVLLMIHPDTNGWLALEVNMQAACVLGYGQNFWLFNQFYPSFDQFDLLEDEE